jgi:hypothetical protein
MNDQESEKIEAWKRFIGFVESQRGRGGVIGQPLSFG